MDHKTNVADMKVVKAGVKTNIVDEGLGVLYHPMFYNKKQAYNILQKLKTEIVDQGPDSGSFKSLTMSSNSNNSYQNSYNSYGPQLSNGKEEILRTVYKKTMENVP